MIRRTLNLSASAALFAAFASYSFGQTAKAPAFDVVSIRLSKAGGAPHAEITPDGYRVSNLPLLVPILVAYVPEGSGDGAFFNDDQVLGAPAWARSDRYDLEAKVAEADMAEWKNPATQKAMLRAMLQAMLADRLKLTVHRATKESSIYGLVIAKNGPKLKESKPDDPRPAGIALLGGAVLVPSNSGQTLNFYNATMASFATVLTNFAGGHVQDQTGLTGHYDFTFARPVATPADPQNPNTAPDTGPSIFTAVQEQLGLRLDSRKATVETLTIDRMERPSEN